MARPDRDLAAAAGVAALAALAVATTGDAAVRAVPGILLALFVPGYALSVALFPERRGDGFERLLLALGSSLAISVLAAVALDQAPGGLNARSWCIALAAVTLVSCGVGARRRRAHPRRAAGAPRRIRLAAVALACAACAPVAGALAIARLPATGVQGYTLLWALPKDEAQGTFTVGVRSYELTTTSYVVTARSGTRVVLQRRVTLRPGESWSAAATRAPSIARAVEVALAKAAHPGSTYRRVHLALGAAG